MVQSPTPLPAASRLLLVAALFGGSLALVGMPANAKERSWWIAVAVLAGMGEEITWRGVQAALVGVVTGNFSIAALVCSTSFGLIHIIQGWRSAAVIAIFALGFHTLVWLAGSLYVAVAESTDRKGQAENPTRIPGMFRPLGAVEAL